MGIQSNIAGKNTGRGWDELDLASLEAEAFLLGIWKNYNDLESSMSIPELLVTLEESRKQTFENRKFAAAMKGIDLDGEKENPVDAARKRIAAKNIGSDISPDDIIADSNFGVNVNNGIGYERI